MKKLIVTFVIVCFAGCAPDPNIVEKYDWKYIEGYRVSDWLSDLTVKDDTIFRANIPIGILKSTNFYFDHYYLKMKSLESDSIGLYTSK